LANKNRGSLSKQIDVLTEQLVATVETEKQGLMQRLEKLKEQLHTICSEKAVLQTNSTRKPCRTKNCTNGQEKQNDLKKLNPASDKELESQIEKGNSKR